MYNACLNESVGFLSGSNILNYKKSHGDDMSLKISLATP